MTIKSREQFFQLSSTIRTETVFIPEWSESVNVRELTGAQRDEWEKSMIDLEGKKHKITIDNARAKLISLSVVDDKGELLFTERDIEQIGQGGSGAISKIYDVAASLSGISDEDVEELVKNSGSGPSAASGSN
jgi:hypothetical protein